MQSGVIFGQGDVQLAWSHQLWFVTRVRAAQDTLTQVFIASDVDKYAVRVITRAMLLWRIGNVIGKFPPWFGLCCKTCWQVGKDKKFKEWLSSVRRQKSGPVIKAQNLLGGWQTAEWFGERSEMQSFLLELVAAGGHDPREGHEFKYLCWGRCTRNSSWAHSQHMTLVSVYYWIHLL